jgi:3-hydroxyacyl-CoA dehydrogenase
MRSYVVATCSRWQAMLMFDRGDATTADIDLSMQLGAGHPMGPLHLMDYIGIDTALSIVQGWRANYPDEPAFVIPKCLEAKVKAGDLGRKTGKGFYNWDGDKILDAVDGSSKK